MKSRHYCLIVCCLLVVTLAAGLFSGCGQTAQAYCELFDIGDIEIIDEKVALSGAPAAVANYMLPVPSGTAVKEKNGAVIDYSNVTDGYVMAQYKENTDKTLRVQVEGPTTKYSYYLKPGEWTTYSLSDGNGGYKVGIYIATEGNKYSKITSASFDVTLKNEFGPFLYSNPYVNFEKAPNTIELAAKLTKGREGALDKVSAIYDYVISNFTYDDELAQTVSSNYLPELDKVLEKKKGICFDYAAVMAGMLRSQKVPVKMVIGYADDIYHAWLSVFSEETGWVDAAVYFDGRTWMRMDPTFAATGGNTEKIKEFIGDGNHYIAKYFY